MASTTFRNDSRLCKKSLEIALESEIWIRARSNINLVAGLGRGRGYAFYPDDRHTVVDGGSHKPKAVEVFKSLLVSQP